MDLIRNFGIACVKIPCVNLSCKLLDEVQSTRREREREDYKERD
jgi:hypothetical protein